MNGPTLEQLRERRKLCRSHVGIVQRWCVGPDRKRARLTNGCDACSLQTGTMAQR